MPPTESEGGWGGVEGGAGCGFGAAGAALCAARCANVGWANTAESSSASVSRLPIKTHEGAFERRPPNPMK